MKCTGIREKESNNAIRLVGFFEGCWQQQPFFGSYKTQMGTTLLRIAPISPGPLAFSQAPGYGYRGWLSIHLCR